MSEKDKPNKDDKIKTIVQNIKEISKMFPILHLNSLYNLPEKTKKYFNWIENATNKDFCKQLDLCIGDKKEIDNLEKCLNENNIFNIEKLDDSIRWFKDSLFPVYLDTLEKEHEKMKKENILFKKLFSRQTQNDSQFSRSLKCNSIEYCKIKLLNENLINLNNKYFEELELYKKEVRKRYPRITSKIENIIKQKELKKKKENNQLSIKLNNIINLPNSQNKYNNNKKLETRLNKTKLPPIKRKVNLDKVFAHPKGIQGMKSEKTYFDKELNKLKGIPSNKFRKK